jgi:hypothetical protein
VVGESDGGDMLDFFCHLWCRLTVGHQFMQYGEDSQARQKLQKSQLYMCANCLKIIKLYLVA